MSKIYTITRNGRPASMGAQGKMAWRTPRYVIYHLTRGHRYRNSEQYEVHTIDLKNEVVSKMSSTAFVALHRNPELVRTEIAQRFGFESDLGTLEAMYRLNVLVPDYKSQVQEFLRQKGIDV